MWGGANAWISLYSWTGPFLTVLCHPQHYGHSASAYVHIIPLSPAAVCMLDLTKARPHAQHKLQFISRDTAHQRTHTRTPVEINLPNLLNSHQGPVSSPAKLLLTPYATLHHTAAVTKSPVSCIKSHIPGWTEYGCGDIDVTAF